MLVGLVARLVVRLNSVYSMQSAKSVYPLAMANCKENRFIINFYHSMLPKCFFSFTWHSYELFTTHSIDTFPLTLSLLKACSFVDYM